MKFLHSTVTDGNMDFRFGERDEVEKNRSVFFEKCGLRYEDAVVMQVEHEDKIVDIRHQTRSVPSLTDNRLAPTTEICEALITDQPGVPLMLLTADCYPCVIYDPVHTVVALLHLGWKPTGLRLVEKVVAHMHKEYGSEPKDLQVYFGPGIAKESYVAESPSQMHDEAWRPYLFDTHDRAGMHVDIVGYARAQGTASGVLPDKVHVDGTDTYTSPNYFSHYRATRTGEREGRFATVVVL